MASYSLITVDAVLPGGLVSGGWLQGCCRGLGEAAARCAATSAANGGQPCAVVPEFGGPCPVLDGARVDGVRPLFAAGMFALPGVPAGEMAMVVSRGGPVSALAAMSRAEWAALGTVR